MAKPKDFQEDDEGSGTGSGGKTGKITARIKDAMSTGPRDDSLSEQHLSLLKLHDDVNERALEQTRELMKEREAAKEQGKKVLFSEKGLHAGNYAQQGHFLGHPVFADLPEGVYADKKMSLQTNENDAELNPELQNQLRHEHQLQHQPAPKFNPKPSFGGG